MSKIRNLAAGLAGGALALLCVLAIGLRPVSAEAGAHPTFLIKSMTLMSSATRTADACGSWTNLGYRALPGVGGTAGYFNKLSAHLDVTTASSGTLDVTVYGRFCSTCTRVALTPASGWTQVTTATSSQFRTFLGPIPPEIQACGDSLGTATDSSHVYSIRALAGS